MVRHEQGLKATTIDEVLALPDEEIDIATAILLLSKQWDKAVDVEKYRKQLDEMAISLEPIVAGKQTTDAIVQAINNYLFEELKYGVPKEENEKLFMLHSVLDTKRGNCQGLSILYLSLAERLNLPIYGVHVPNHLFVRYDDDKIRINIETTDKGRADSDDDYIRAFNIPIETRNFYLVNLNKKQMIGSFLNSLGVAYYNQGKLDDAIAEYKRAISINSNDVDAHYNLGNVYKDQDKLDDAIKEYQKVICIRPNHACAHCRLGAAYASKDELDLVIAEYEKTIEMKPDCAEAHNNLGDAYKKQGKLGEATVEYKIATSIVPNYAKAHYNLGYVYSDQDKLDDAIKEYQKVICIAPDNACAHCRLGTAYRSKGEWDLALAAYKKAIEIKPDCADAHCFLGFTYGVRDKLEESIAELKTATRINPKNDQAHIGLSIAYIDQGKLDEAIDEYKIVIGINPNDAIAHDGLGLAYKRQGKLDEAIGEWKTAISINPNHANTHYDLACCYSLKNSKEQAIELLNKAIVLDVDYADMVEEDEDFDNIRNSAEFRKQVPTVDVSHLVCEAKMIVRKVAAVYLKHISQWFIGLVVHGSALRGGFIPGCSDIDVQLYLEDSAFKLDGQLPLELGLSIHRDLSKIDPAPFRYIQSTVLSSELPEWFVGPIPGAYHLVAGRLPVAEATTEQLRDASRKALEELIPIPTFITGALLDHGGGRLEDKIRLLCTKVWPTLYHVLTLQQEDAIRVWGLPKEQTMGLLPKNSSLSQKIHEFYQAVQTYYPAEESIEQGLAVVESGVVFLEAAKSWWDEENTSGSFHKSV